MDLPRSVVDSAGYFVSSARELDIKGEAAGAHVDRSPAWISHLEAGRVGIRPKMLNEILDLYGIDGSGERKELQALAVGGRERGWWSDYSSLLSKQYSTYAGYEDDAVELFIYETLVVDGLLQTEEYATAVVKASRPNDSESAIAKRVQVRMNRQRRLLGEDPLRILVVLDEAVLHRVDPRRRRGSPPTAGAPAGGCADPARMSAYRCCPSSTPCSRAWCVHSRS